MVGETGLEPVTPACKAGAPQLSYSPVKPEVIKLRTISKYTALRQMSTVSPIFIASVRSDVSVNS